MSIEPSRRLGSIRLLEAGGWGGVEGISHCVKLPSHVAQRQAAAAKQRLSSRGVGDVDIAVETYPVDRDQHLAPGSGITLLMKSRSGAVIGADSTVHIQPVRVGDRTGNLWIIEEGLQPNQLVVVEGLQKVREGMTVAATRSAGDQYVQHGPSAQTPTGR